MIPRQALTERQKAQYLLGRCSRCPYCGSRDLERAEMEHDGPDYYRAVTCLVCEAAWVDLFGVTGIDA